MIYEKDAPKSTAYISVNQLIQPKKKYSGLSIMPPYAAGVQTKSISEGQAPVAFDPAPELAASSETAPGNAPLSATAVTPEQTTAPEAAAEPTGFAWSVDQLSEQSAEAVPIKAESFVLPESAIDAGAKAEQNEAEVDQQPGMLQQKSSATAAAATATPGANLNKLAAPRQGEPLPEAFQQQMEHTLGMDFTNVRLHRDSQSATLAADLGAKAFTKGEDIYFNQGEYNPATNAGQQLIAHELTHVKQQRIIPGLQYRLAEPAVRDRYEQEADAVADQVAGSVGSSGMRADNATEGAARINNAAGVQCKEASGPGLILKQVGAMLRRIPGYETLTIVIGRDSITGQEVKREGFAFIKALVGLVPGGEKLLENLAKANVITRAVSWFKAEFQKLEISFQTIKNLFSQAWQTLSPGDVVLPVRGFNKLKHIFMAPIKRVMNFIKAAGPKMAELVFEGALALAGAPVKLIMGVLNKGQAVLQQIFHDPIGFLQNLINAVKGGLSNFVGNLQAHLQNGIGGWLFGALSKAGLALPEKLNLAGIFSLVAQVLGVTWQAIRAIVLKRLGPSGEKVMSQVEQSIAFVSQLITKGPVALLELAQEFIGELPGRFFNSVIEWVRNTIIVKAIQKLLSMFNPAGAIIQAVIAIYHTVQFFIERAQQIAVLVGAVLNSIAAIAGGKVDKAVAAVENALAKALPVTISFLANFIGLGGIVAKIKEIIQKLRKPIEKVVGKVVGLVVRKAKLLAAKLTGGDQSREEPPKNQAEHDDQVKAGLAALEGEQKKKDEDHDAALTYEEAEEAAQKVKAVYPVFKSIIPVENGDRWVFEYVASKGKVNGFKVSKVVDTAEWLAEKEIYSVVYEVKLPKDMYPNVSSQRHFQEANKQLYDAFQKDSGFAQQMEELYPGIIEGVQPGKRGAFSRKPPTDDLTWHHHSNREGVMQLIPFEQHTAKGKIQSILHPDRKGGMEIWGGGR